MKIAQADKQLIIEKITQATFRSLTIGAGDAKQLLVQIYTDWYKKEIQPYKNEHLFKYLIRSTNLEIKFTNASGERIKILAPNSSNRLVNINTLSKKELPPGIQLIQNVAGSWSKVVNVGVISSELEQKIREHNKLLNDAQDKTNQVNKDINQVLDTVKTYNQLQKQLPGIYNAIPQELKDKYEAYRQRLRQRRTSKPKVEKDFKEVETLLAMDALNKLTGKE